MRHRFARLSAGVARLPLWMRHLVVGTLLVAVLLVAVAIPDIVDYYWLLQSRVEFWRVAFECLALLAIVAPPIFAPLQRLLAASRRQDWVTTMIVGCIVTSIVAFAIGYLEHVGILPWVAPPVAALLFGTVLVLGGAMNTVKLGGVAGSVPGAILMLSQTAFFTWELIRMHRPNLAEPFAIASCVVALISCAVALRFGERSLKPARESFVRRSSAESS
ncbi:MAG TPA: hypothetical protein VMD91_08635 [Candidatus Sulfotelmatobacter sp.]|nr:hypothetical protein [Candidatus Sulfotelmatobacter sp.]